MASARANNNARWEEGAGPLKGEKMGGRCEEQGARADEVHALVIKGDKVLAAGRSRCRAGLRGNAAMQIVVDGVQPCGAERLFVFAKQGCRNVAIPADVLVRR